MLLKPKKTAYCHHGLEPGDLPASQPLDIRKKVFQQQIK